MSRDYLLEAARAYRQSMMHGAAAEWLSEHGERTDTISSVVARLITSGYFTEHEVAAARQRAAATNYSHSLLLMSDDYIARYGQPGATLADAYLRRHPERRVDSPGG